MAHFGDYQNEIYLAGLQGVITRVPVDFPSLVARATAAMPPSVLNYV
jgi:lactate 2-monooxygenase